MKAEGPWTAVIPSPLWRARAAFSGGAVRIKAVKESPQSKAFGVIAADFYPGRNDAPGGGPVRANAAAAAGKHAAL